MNAQRDIHGREEVWRMKNEKSEVEFQKELFIGAKRGNK